MEKIIITVAPVGSVTLPSQTPYLPLKPEEYAEEVYRCRMAGASIVHLHARLPDGQVTSDLKIWRHILRSIRERCPDIIICVSTGGGLGTPLSERIAVVPEFTPEICSLNMGSMNFVIPPQLKNKLKFKYRWEPTFIEGTQDTIFKNTFKDIEYFLKTMYENDVKPELEIYDLGMLNTVKYQYSMGNLRFPIHMQFVLGVLGGVDGSVENLIYFRNASERLFGKENFTWSVIGVGYPTEFYVGSLATILGGHVRVGLEDNLYIRKGELAKSNAELVNKMVKIAGELGREIATPDEARKILGLKGADKTLF